MATPNVLRDNTVQNAEPPFSNSQVSETATHREILNIYQHARPETKYFYDMGRDTQGLEEENWVIRWLLWHVFRYRDNRNKNRRQGSPDLRSPSSSENSSSESQAQASHGMSDVPPMYSQASETIRRQQWRFEWKLVDHEGVLRSSPRHLSSDGKSHSWVLPGRPFACCAVHWRSAESDKSGKSHGAGGR